MRLCPTQIIGFPNVFSCWSMGASACKFSPAASHSHRPAPTKVSTILTNGRAHHPVPPSPTATSALTPNSVFPSTRKLSVPVLPEPMLQILETRIAQLGAEARPNFLGEIQTCGEFFPRAAAVVAERVPRRRAVGRYMQQYFDTQNNTKIQIQLQTHM